MKYKSALKGKIQAYKAMCNKQYTKKNDTIFLYNEISQNQIIARFIPA